MGPVYGVVVVPCVVVVVGPVYGVVVVHCVVVVVGPVYGVVFEGGVVLGRGALPSVALITSQCFPLRRICQSRPSPRPR